MTRSGFLMSLAPKFVLILYVWNQRIAKRKYSKGLNLQVLILGPEVTSLKALSIYGKYVISENCSNIEVTCLLLCANGKGKGFLTFQSS